MWAESIGRPRCASEWCTVAFAGFGGQISAVDSIQDPKPGAVRLQEVWW